MRHDKFIYKKVQILRDDVTYFYWYMINKKKRDGVHFHGVHHKDDEVYAKYAFEGNNYNFTAHGIEIHSPTKMYDHQTPIKNCEVTQGDCYCDGTSLGAIEDLGHICPNGNDSFIWYTLSRYYINNFGEE